jgi:2,4'-dihydroxyacetophenone dioxygenase
MGEMPTLPTKEILVDQFDPDKWMTVEKTGFRLYHFWEHPDTGASIVLLDVPEGLGVPVKHIHASNQFMYCLEGKYEYTDSGLILRPGSFYMNPKGHPHGPTIAHKKSLLIEMYDGPHYYETPSYHTEGSVGKVVDKE